MPEFTVIHCGTIQPHNSKWAPSAKTWNCRTCGYLVETHRGIYGPALPPGYLHPTTKRYLSSKAIKQNMCTETLMNLTCFSSKTIQQIAKISGTKTP